MPVSRDPLHYGLRALEEMAREQASVAPPGRAAGDTFAPHPVLRGQARDGAALSLRLFGDDAAGGDDATDFVLRGASELRLAPIPPRAAALFEAHAAAKAAETEESMTVGFPLVTFVQQGATRAAPLFSRGGTRARWTSGETTWRLPRGARDGVAMTLPDGLVLEASDEVFGLHGGLWFELFGLDGATLARLGAEAPRGLGALVRAATRLLEGGEGDEPDEPDAPREADAPREPDEPREPDAPADTAPLAAEDLAALCAAATRRAHARRGLKCFPHALVMLPPRGDPTSSLRTELRALADQPSPPRGPLAVYLGAPAAPPREAPLWSCGRAAPTPSQLAAARAFEGSSDLVAVCGPPGCGKTALLHHVAAQTVVDAALGKLWTMAPSRVHPWPLVVTSTNNAAVDHALAPFLRAPSLPLALRFGNRRLLAEVTAPALAAVEDALGRADGPSLAEARAAFEALAAPVRAHERDAESSRTAEAAARARRGSLELRANALRALVARAAGRARPGASAEELDRASAALDAHVDAASKLPALHLDGPAPSPERAVEKWARANELRGPRIAPALAALGLAVPYGPLDAATAREGIADQRRAIEATKRAVDDAREVLSAASAPDEIAAIEAELARAPTARAAPAPDPALYDAALAVRDAWARAHRAELGRRLAAARAALGDERGAARTKPLGVLLQELSPLFPVVGCTLLSLRAAFPLERDVVDRLVVDEAAQCAPVYAIPALARARRAMLTGDVAQLPPVYTLDPRVDARLSEGLAPDAIAPFRMNAASTSSAQAVAEPRARARVSLVEHFRSQAPIVALASRWSGYTLDVRTPPRALSHVSRRLVAPVTVVGVDGEGVRATGGVVNEAEASEAVALVLGLLEDGVAPSDVAVLTPFVGQSHWLERALHDRGVAGRDGVLVSTVHKLQGGERRVVVFSVTATAPKHLRWLAARGHLLHVATSRAQDHLVVLVSPEATRREPALAPFAELLG